jgi:hypothetical protein
MRRFWFTVAIFAAILTFSCDTTNAPFDDSLPGRFTLTTTASPSDGGTIQPSGGEFVDGARIELRATANEGFVFQQWQGDRTGTSNPDVFFIRRNMNITAVFAELQFQLTVNVIGEGTVTQEIISQEASEVQEKQIALPPPPAVIEREMDVQRDGSELRDSRSDELRRPEPGDVRIQQDRAPPQIERQERVELRPQVSANQVIATYRLTAEPDQGWRFDRWEGDLTGDENPAEIVVDSDKNVTAVFVQEDSEQFSLEIITEGQGTVEIDPDLEEYPDGTEVTLNAVPEEGWRFARWQGDLDGSENPAVIVMDEDKVITSIFEEEGAPQLTISTQPSQTVAGEAISPAPAVTLVDGFGDPIQGVSVTASLNQNSFADGSAVTAQTNGNGIAAFTNLRINTAAEGYRITFDADLENVSDIESSAFSVVAAAGDPSNTSASVPDGVAGEETVITITVLDEFDNPVSGAADDLSVSVSGANSATATVTEQGGAGEYRAVYTPTSAGTDNIEITLDGEPIEGSPYTSVVTVSDVSSANSSAMADPNELQVGESSTLTITLRDDQNNAVSGLSDEITITGLGDATAGDIIEDGDTGVYTTNITNTVSGEITLTITADGVTITDNLVITFLAGDPDAIEIVSGDDQSATVTQQLPDPLVVSVSDEFGNPVEGFSVGFEITGAPAGAAGQSLSAESAVTNASGQASVTFTLGDTPGTYRVQASAGSAGSVTFTAQAQIGEPSVMTITQQPGQTTAGNAISPAPAVEITDDAGNPVEGVQVTVSEQGGASFSSGTISLSTNSSGEAIFDDLVFNTAGSYTLVFSADASAIDDEISDEFTVVAAAPDPDAADVTVPDGVAGEQTVITILLEDAFGNPVTGAASNLTVTVSGVNTASPDVTETGTPGEYRAVYTPTSAGTDQVAIELNNTPLPDSPFTSEVTVSDVSSANSSATADPGELQVGESSTLTITLRDAQNNAVSGLADAITISGLGNATAGDVTEDGSSGVYTSEITSTIPEEITITVVADGVTLSDNPVITFLPGDPDEIEIVSGNNQTGTVLQQLPDPLVVQVNDEFGNPVPGHTVEFEITDGPALSAGESLSETSVTTGSDGWASTELTLGSVPGTYEVTADAGAAGSVTFSATAQIGQASVMNITQQPSETMAGDVITPAPAIAVIDDAGNPVEGVDVTVSEQSDASFSGGTLTQSTDGSGIATFDDLVFTLADTYALVFDADAPGVASVTSQEFDVNPAAADPANTTATVPDGTAGNPTTITITVFDEFDNPVSGVAGDLAISITGANSANPSAEETTDPGVYTATYTPVTAGTDNVSITLGGLNIDGSPFTSEVTVSDISASESSVTTDPASLAAGGSSTVTVQLRDGSGNAIEGLESGDFSISVTGSASASTISETTTPGTYQFSVTNTTAQTVTVTVSASGVQLQDQPTIEFVPGAVDAIAIQTQPGETVAGEAIAGPPRVRLLDEFDNRVPGVEVTVSELGGQSFASGELTITSNSAGESIFTDLVITPTGQYTLVFTASGVSGGSLPFSVIPSAADPAETTASVPNGAAGDATNISITVRDAFGNRVSGVAGSLSVSVTGGPNSGASFTDINESGNGVYTTSYTPETTGEDEITITLDGTDISSSPFTSTVITSDADVVIVTVQPGETEAGQPVAGPPTVRVDDDLGNPVEGVEVNVSEAGGQDFASGTTTQFTDNLGFAVFGDLVFHPAGTYTLVFNAIGVTENAESDPFDVVPAPASAQLSDADVQQTVIAGESGSISINIRDEFGNPVEEVDVSDIALVVISGGANEGAAFDPVTDAGGGVYTTSYTPTVSGIDEIAITFEGTAIVGSPYRVDIIPADVERFEFDTIAGPQTAGQAFEITITAFDQFDNIGQGYSGTASLSTTAGSISPDQATFTDGVATLDVTVSEAGADRTITAADGDISGTSNTFDVQSGGVDAGESEVTADPATLTAGGSSTVTIVLRDGSGNPVGGLQDTDFTLDVSGNADEGVVTETGTTGTYTTEVTNNTAETVTVTVTASGVTLNDTPSITFLAGAAAAITAESGDGQTGTVTQTLADPFTVRVADQFNNPVSGATISFSIIVTPDDATGQSLSQASVETDTDGLASSTLTLGDKPGTYTVEASAGSVGPVIFTATAQIGQASVMNITEQPSETTAGEVITPAPAVEVTDDAGNPVEGISISVSEQGGATFSSGTLTQSTNALGIASFSDLIFNTANTYALVFDADAPGVTDVTSQEFDVNPAAANPDNTTAVVPDGTAGNPTTITITVLDEFDNPVSGEAGNLSVIVSGANSATPAVTETGTPGQYTAGYTPTTAGEDNVEITLNGVEISNSPQTSTVTVSDISATNSSVEADPLTLQAGSSSTLTIQLRDGSNNPIGGVTDFDVNVSGSGSPGSVSETSTTGTYEASVTNNTAETVTVTVTAGGVVLQDQPEITFTAADPSTMTITTEPEASVAGEPIVGPPTVEIVDSFGNPVPDAVVNVTEQGGASFVDGSETSVNTNSSGRAVFDNIAIGPVGSYNLVFSSAGVTNRTSNAFTISAGTPDAGETTASVPNGSAGDATNISITVRDAFGNRVEGVAALLAVSVTDGPNAGATFASITDSGNGVYNTSYTPTVTGDDEITITLDGGGIQGSPFTSTVSTSDAEEVVMEQQPLETVAGEVIVGPPSVRVNDGLGNAVPDVDVTVSIDGGLDFDGGTLTRTTAGNGIAVFNDLVLNTAGSYVLIFDAVGVADNAESDPFDVVAGAASSSTIVSGNNQTAVVTQVLENPYVVRLTDTFNNPIVGHGVEFSIDQTPDGAAGQVLSVTNTTTDASGEASTVLTLGNLTGTYTVTADAGTAGTNEFEATAEPDAADSFEFGTISSPQTAGQNFEITITAFDQFGNPATGYGGTASLSTTAGTITPGQAEFNSGVATLDVSVSQAGSEQSITVADGGIEGISNTFEVQTGGVDADESSANATSPHTADGADASVLTIGLVDSNDNVISGLLNEDFNIGLTGNAVAGNVTEVSEGQYQASITNTTAETVTVTVTANGIQLTDEPQILFEAGAATQISSLTIADDEIALDGSTTVTATVLDANNNPVEGVSVSFASDQPDRATVASPVLTNASGQATATVTGSDNQAGGVVITASISDADANVAESDNETIGLTVLAGAADAGQSTIGANPSEGLTANGTDASTLTITVSDGGGNLLDGEEVFFAITSGSGGALSSGPWTTNAGGPATATLTSVEANTLTVTGYLGTDDSGSEVGTVDVTFEAGEPASVTADAIQGTAAANDSDELEFLVTVEDANNNPVPGVTVEATNNGTDITYTGGGASQLTNGSGQVTFTAASSTVQSGVTFTFTEQVNDITDTATGSFTDASGFDVAGPGSQTAGEQFNVVISNATGVDGDPLEGSINVTVTSNLDDDEVHNAAVTFTGGAADVPVTLTTADDHILTVDVADVTANQTVPVSVTAAAASLIIITQQPTETSAGEAISPAPQVRVEDQFENPVADEEVTVSLNGADFVSGTLLINTDSNGLATFSDLVITEAGTGYTLTFNADGVDAVDSGSFDVTAAGPDLLSTTANVPNGTAGQETIIMVTVEDEFGNRVSGVTDLIVNVSGANSETGLILTELPEGQYEFRYSPAISGDDFVEILLDSEEIPGSPFTSNVSPDAAETIEFDTIGSQTAGVPFSITLTARDGEGNIATGFNETADLSTTAGTIVPDEVNFEDGTVTISVTVSEAGEEQTISVNVESLGTIFSSNEFDVNPPPDP